MGLNPNIVDTSVTLNRYSYFSPIASERESFKETQYSLIAHGQEARIMHISEFIEYCNSLFGLKCYFFAGALTEQLNRLNEMEPRFNCRP